MMKMDDEITSNNQFSVIIKLLIIFIKYNNIHWIIYMLSQCVDVMKLCGSASCQQGATDHHEHGVTD